MRSNDGKQPSVRAWRTLFDSLPPLKERTALDLGCGVGDQAAEFLARGARLIGVDMNEESLRLAQRRCADAEFFCRDLRVPLDIDLQVDGIWCSFIAAYFPDLPAALERWARTMRPGGWIALTEIDDLFGHEPLGAQTKALLECYARVALTAGRYDFRMGRKLRKYAEESGFKVMTHLNLEDCELSFEGPAEPEALDAWRGRFDRIKLLQEFCGPDFKRVRDEFLDCLVRDDHRATAKVYGCIAFK